MSRRAEPSTEKGDRNLQQYSVSTSGLTSVLYLAHDLVRPPLRPAEMILVFAETQRSRAGCVVEEGFERPEAPACTMQQVIKTI
jgi:hypothetical protein